MIVYTLGFIGGAIVVGLCVYLSTAEHREKAKDFLFSLKDRLKFSK